MSRIAEAVYTLFLVACGIAILCVVIFAIALTANLVQSMSATDICAVAIENGQSVEIYYLDDKTLRLENPGVLTLHSNCVIVHSGLVEAESSSGQ